MLFGIFAGAFISHVVSCLGGLIKQGALYTIYSIIMMIHSVCIHEMIWLKKRVTAISQFVYISCQRASIINLL